MWKISRLLISFHHSKCGAWLGRSKMAVKLCVRSVRINSCLECWIIYQLTLLPGPRHKDSAQSASFHSLRQTSWSAGAAALYTPHPYIPGVFGSLVSPLFHDSEIRKVFLSCGLWAAAGGNPTGSSHVCHGIARNLCVCDHIYTSDTASGESFCGWSQVWNLPACFSLTMEHLPSLNQCLSFSSSDLITAILILLFQVIFPTHAGFHPPLQSGRQLKLNVPEECTRGSAFVFRKWISYWYTS